MIHSVSYCSKIMGLRIAFETLGEIVDHYDGKNCDVLNVETTADGHGETLHATFDLAVPLGSADSEGDRPSFDLEDATLSADGVLSVSLSVSALTALPSTIGSAASVTGTEVDIVDGSAVLGLELAIEPTGAPEGHAETESPPEPNTTGGTDTVGSDAVFADARDESVPAYDDTEYLRTLYEECDNFGEMSRRIEMDVSSETVRRYMIEAGVHQADSYDTARIEGETTEGDSAGTDGPDGTGSPPDTDPHSRRDGRSPDRAGDGPAVGEEIATDGIGLPDGVLIEDVADAVVQSGTVHQVQRHLDLERTPTRELLEELNLLDLVLRPIADSDRAVSYDQVATRLRQCAPSGA